MTPRTVRRYERTAHLVWGLFLALYVYGLLPSWGEPVVRWIVIPRGGGVGARDVVRGADPEAREGPVGDGATAAGYE